MLEALPRGDFLALVGMKSPTLDQRVLTGEAAFAFGCQKPAHTGEYLVLDAVAMLLSSMLNRLAGLELKAAADDVREHWKDWLKLVTRAEREPLPNNPQLFFAVAWLSLEPRRYRVVLGEAHEIAAALAGEIIYTCNFVSIHLLLRLLRNNARRANIALPERLTVADRDGGYENWLREIDAHRERAAARLKAKAKAKPKTKAEGRRAVRAPASKRLVKT
jgi:hypothetical protein